MCQTFNQPMIEKWILYFSNHSHLNDKYRFLVLENFICYLMNRNGILQFFIILMEFFFLEHLSYFLSIFIASLNLHINLNNKIVFCCLARKQCHFYWTFSLHCFIFPAFFDIYPFRFISDLLVSDFYFHFYIFSTDFFFFLLCNMIITFFSFLCLFLFSK